MAETYPILVCYYSPRQNQHQIDLTGYNFWVERADCNVGIVIYRSTSERSSSKEDKVGNDY
jgi:hypothetical protein